MTQAVVYGHLLTAFAQGLIGGLGFLVFGLSSPILWGIIIGIAGLIPMVGTAIVWVPASIYLFLVGILQDSLPYMARGIGLFVYGFLIIGTVDNFLKPKLIGGRAKVHPALILIGLLGGLTVFGLIGAIYGPLILAMLVTFFDIYRTEYEGVK